MKRPWVLVLRGTIDREKVGIGAEAPMVVATPKWLRGLCREGEGRGRALWNTAGYKYDDVAGG